MFLLLYSIILSGVIQADHLLGWAKKGMWRLGQEGNVGVGPGRECGGWARKGMWRLGQEGNVEVGPGRECGGWAREGMWGLGQEGNVD